MSIMYDIEMKLKEINEICGRDLGSEHFSLLLNIFEAAFNLKLISRKYSYLNQQLEERLKKRDVELEDAIVKDYLETRKQVFGIESAKFVEKAEKLESVIAPQILALLRTLEAWMDADEEYSENFYFRHRKEEIGTYLDNYSRSESLLLEFQELLENYYQTVIDHSNRVKDFVLSEEEGAVSKDNLMNFQAEYKDRMHEVRSSFANAQEFEIAEIFFNSYYSWINEANRNLENSELPKGPSQELKEYALSQIESAEKLKHAAIRVLILYRTTSHCLWLTLKESEREEESADIFEELAEHLSILWNPALRKAKFMVQPLIELNQLKIQAITQ